jgi:Zn-dependent peptidase ImmA (M78 family)
MENVQEWMRDYIIASQGDKVSFVGALNVHNKIESLAAAVRKILSLPINWFEQPQNTDDSFKFLRQAISNIGVIVMLNGIVGANTHRALDTNEFRAFTLIDDYAPLIFINSADSRGGMLFSLVHEFLHIGIGKSSLYNVALGDSTFINPYEVVSNAATAEILVPISIFKNEWQRANGELGEKLKTVAAYFKCSQMVIARRALDSGFISNKEYDLFSAQAKQIIKKKSSGGDYYRTQATRIDQRFLYALHASIYEGRTLHTEAFRLTNTNRSTFEGLISEARGERK